MMNAGVETATDDLPYDDHEMKEMMEVSFPVMVDDEDHSEDGSNDAVENNRSSWSRPDLDYSSVLLDGVLFDIHKEGWDEKAIEKCFDLSLAFHECENDSCEPNQFVFRPRLIEQENQTSNEARGEDDEIGSTMQCIQQKNTSRVSEGSEIDQVGKPTTSIRQSNDSLLQNSNLNLPHWAIDP